MTSKKKPDNVVFDEETQSYDAALKPYATNIGAPVITTDDTLAWKKRSITKVNHKIKTKYLELKAEYETMIAEYEYNNLIYNAKFSFEPVIGESYHLYLRSNQEHFLSVISPNECDFDHVGSFRLTADQIWEKFDIADE